MEDMKVDLETAKLNNVAIRRAICARLKVDPTYAERGKEREFLMAVYQRLKESKVGWDGDDKIEKAAGAP